VLSVSATRLLTYRQVLSPALVDVLLHVAVSVLCVATYFKSVSGLLL